jgi:16S rRNA (cytidine1402-2'-O)-methyltransferase
METTGRLVVVSTPIGNLKDITLRALEELKAADAIACEDTRETRKLVSHYDIRVPLWSFHDHSGRGRVDQIVAEIRNGKRVAYVTDSGTPLVSDPGFTLARAAIEAGLPVEVIPGPSAVLAALVGSGLPCEKFAFEGFLPPKEGSRKNALLALAGETRTMVFYESPHRIAKALADMEEVLGDRPACVARELTKKFEEFIRGRLSEVRAELGKRPKLGEIVIVVEGKRD